MMPGHAMDEQEQYLFYTSCLAAARGRTVTVRTFDFGADRTMADLSLIHIWRPLRGLPLFYLRSDGGTLLSQPVALVPGQAGSQLLEDLAVVGVQPIQLVAAQNARDDGGAVSYTHLEQEDWQNGWRKYYHPMDVGQRLAIVPSWQDYDTDQMCIRDSPLSGRRPAYPRGRR